MLHGTDTESFEHMDIHDIDIEAVDEAASKFIKQLDSMSEEEILNTWRKKGFYDKAHNLVIYVNRSP
jgi:hypothetical protein